MAKAGTDLEEDPEWNKGSVEQIQTIIQKYCETTIGEMELKDCKDVVPKILKFSRPSIFGFILFSPPPETITSISNGSRR